MSERFKQYKRKLRWKSTMRKESRGEWQPEGWDMPEAQNPNDPYLEAHHGPWRAVWNGGRLADIYHAESDSPLHAMQVGAYDWQHGRLANPVTPESLRAKLQDWAGESGGEYEENVLPYQ